VRWETCLEAVAGVRGCFSGSLVLVEGRRRERFAIAIE
jgi:hypothetical protein